MHLVSRLVSRFPVRALALSSAAVFAAASTAGAQAITLNANATSNNGGSPNWALFFDLSSTTNVTVTELATANNGAAGAAFTIEVFVYNGSGLGGPVSAGPGSSAVGWTSLGVANATQGPVASGISLPVDIPDIVVTPGQTTGVALLFSGAGPRYFGTGTPPYQVFSDANLTLTTGDSRSAPFTPSGSFFSSRGLTGSLTYSLGTSNPTVYCTAGTSTNGCVPAISASAQPSVAQANACLLSVANVEGQKSGLIFYGIDNTGYTPLTWGTGSSSFLCVKPPTQRMLTQSSGGTAGACDGALTQDFNAFLSAYPSSLGQPFTAGDKVFAQAWYRDPQAVKTTNLSDAVELTFAP